MMLHFITSRTYFTLWPSLVPRLRYGDILLGLIFYTMIYIWPCLGTIIHFSILISNFQQEQEQEQILNIMSRSQRGRMDGQCCTLSPAKTAHVKTTPIGRERSNIICHMLYLSFDIHFIDGFTPLPTDVGKEKLSHTSDRKHGQHLDPRVSLPGFNYQVLGYRS